MGTDIHGVLQSKYKSSDHWHTECEIERDRNYRLFAALADVRNGYGFAGVPTHEAIKPIAEPRGWPDNFKLKEALWREDDPWMGDHSYSWLSLDELAGWAGWDQPLRECGFISRDEYNAWDCGGPPPNGWCGGISGRDIITVDQRTNGWWVTKDWTHVRVYWSRPLRESCKAFLAWVDYAKAKTEGYEARIVFGFDS